MEDAYLLDTSIATIAWNSSHKQYLFVREKLAALGGDSISVSAISVAEVLYGQDVQPYPDIEHFQTVHEAMRKYKLRNVDQHTAEYYAKIRGELFRRHAPRDNRDRLKKRIQPEDLVDRTTARELGIQENDLWIVSIAVQYDLVFITRDKKIKRILEIAKDLFGYDRYKIWDLAATQQSDEDQ